MEVMYWMLVNIDKSSTVVRVVQLDGHLNDEQLKQAYNEFMGDYLEDEDIRKLEKLAALQQESSYGLDRNTQAFLNVRDKRTLKRNDWRVGNGIQVYEGYTIHQWGSDVLYCIKTGS